MTGWLEFTLALIAFLATHFVPARRGLRDRLIALLGRRVYFSAYGIISLAVVAWLIVAAGRAPHVALWWQMGWHRWVPVLTMPVAILLAVLVFGFTYPYTLGGRRGARFDPARAGVAAVTRHPLLWSLTLWAGAHLVANGDLAHVILFGGFATLSLAAMRIFDARARAAMTAGEWQRVQQATAILSARPFCSLGWWRANGRALLRAVIIAALVYVAIFMLHEPVIGVTPVPG